MPANQRIYQFGDYRTLPLRIIRGRAKGAIPAFGKGEIQPEHTDPNYEAAPFSLNRTCLTNANANPGYAIEVLQSWITHFGNLAYFIQFENDPDGERFKRFHSHTELASLILSNRLNLDSESLWEMFEWLLQFKYVQEDYRADVNRDIKYAYYVERLEKVDELHSGRHKAGRIVDRAIRQIQLDTSKWQVLPEVTKTEAGGARRAATIFYSYSHKDEGLRDELQKHLSILQRSGIIEQWHDRRIGVGDDWKGEIDEHLKKADIVLLLISSDFLSSDYCYDVELQLALKRHMTGDAIVVPIFLRPCDWVGSAFGKLQGAPTDAKPVTSWTNQDEAFTDVARHIRQLADEFRNVTPD